MKALTSLAATSVILFYFWTMVSSSLFSNWIEDPTPEKAALHYNHLTSGFLHGQLNLYFPSKAEMATGKYNPKENDPKQMDDVTPYNGKYYLYFGVIPVVFFFLPFQILTGWALPQEVVCFFVFSGAFLFSFLLLRLLISKIFPKLEWMLLLVTPVLGISCCAVQLLRRPRHYELAIGSGQFFLMGGLYYGFRVLLREGNNKLNLFIASICFVSAFGSRPTTLIVSCTFALLYIVEYFRERASKRRYRFRGVISEAARFGKEHFFVVLLPTALGVFLLLIYNYMRFGSWLEFGINPLVISYNNPKFIPFSLRYVPFNLTHFLFRPYPEANGGFHIVAKVISIVSNRYENFMRVLLEPGYLNLEPTFGLLFQNPFVFLASFWLGPSFFLKKGSEEARKYGLYFLFAGLFSLLFLCTNGGMAQRYHIEFAGLFFFSAILAWMYLFERFYDCLRVRIALLAFLTVAFTTGLYFSTTIYVQSHTDLSGIRTWINRNLLYTPSQAPKRLLELSKNNIVLLVKFTHEKPGREPLVVAGTRFEADMVYVRFLGNHQVQFGANHWGMKEVEGKVILIDADVYHRLDFLLGFQYPKPKYLENVKEWFPFLDPLYHSDEQTLIQVSMDGKIVLSTYTPYFESSRHSLRIGHNPLGGGLVNERFSGELQK